MKRTSLIVPFLVVVIASLAATQAIAAPRNDRQCTPDLSRQTDADARGMRMYVLAILKDGPTPVADAARQKEIIEGHFANMERLTNEGALLTAGPFGENDRGWRGIFLLATDSVDKAAELMKTDPGVAAGVFAVEYHRWYGTAAAMHLPELHRCQMPTAVE